MTVFLRRIFNNFMALPNENFTRSLHTVMSKHQVVITRNYLSRCQHGFKK